MGKSLVSCFFLRHSVESVIYRGLYRSLFDCILKYRILSECCYKTPRRWRHYFGTPYIYSFISPSYVVAENKYNNEKLNKRNKIERNQRLRERKRKIIEGHTQ